MAKLKLDLHDIYNRGDQIDAALDDIIRQALDRGERAVCGQLSVSEQTAGLQAPLYAPVRALDERVDPKYRLGPLVLRNALNAPNQSNADLPANEEPTGGSASAGTHQAR